MNKKSIADKLHSMENTFLGATANPEILERLGLYGYTEEEIANGKAKLDKVIHLTTAQVKEYGNQYAATNEQDQYLTSTYGKYMVIVKLSRVAFKNQTDILSSLGVIGDRPRSLSGWLHSARTLYMNLLELPNALEVMSRYGYTVERLQMELQDVEEVEKLHIKQLSGKSTAQRSTQKRDEAFDELCNWFSDFRAVIRIALYDEPQLLEALGIAKK